MSEIKEREVDPQSLPGQWFVINSNTGHEDKVRLDLLEKVKNQNLSKVIFDVRISKYTTETKSGKETVKNRFPGYIFVNMLMTEEAWFIVRNTPGVTGFIGSSGKGAKPFPLTANEVDTMLNAKESETTTPIVDEVVVEEVKKTKTPGQAIVVEKVLYKADYKVGDVVVILEGPFKDKEGKVVDMDYEKGVAIVSIEMFGRYTPTEVHFKNAKSIIEYNN